MYIYIYLKEAHLDRWLKFNLLLEVTSLKTRRMKCFIAVGVVGFLGELRKLELREAKEIFTALAIMNGTLTTC